MGDGTAAGLGRTVILGHTGMIGRPLYEHLRGQGVDVHGFASKEVNLLDGVALDKLDPLVDEGTTLIFASANTPDKGNTVARFEENVRMAANVARFLEARPLRKCVLLSTDGVYAMTPEPVTEGSPLDLEAFYPLGKYAAERILAHTAQATGLKLLILRPTGVYGPGDTHNSYGPNRFVRQIVEGGTVRLFGTGADVRDHLFLDDLVRIVAELAASDATGVVNVASGESRAFASIVEDLRAVVPTDFTIEHAPGGATPTVRTFDLSRLRSLLPNVRFTPFRDGLRAAYEWRAALPSEARA
jgi:UDP-glucose 4-epimerase